MDVVKNLISYSLVFNVNRNNNEEDRIFHKWKLFDIFLNDTLVVWHFFQLSGKDVSEKK